MSKPWSYSLLSDFETCPRRFYFTRETREVVEPPNEAMTHGNQVHKVLEQGIRDGAAPPQGYEQYAPYIATARAAPGEHLVEYKFGLDRVLRPTGFFSPDVWVRGVFDFVALRGPRAVVLDWKTGKPKVDRDQLTLFAAATLATFGQIEAVKTGYVWLAHGKIDREVFVRADAPGIWDEFRARVARVDLARETNNFPPSPSGLCRKHCPVPFSKCEFSGNPG